MTSHKFLQPWEDINKLYVLKRKEEDGWTNIKDCVDVAIQAFEEYDNRSKEKPNYGC